MKRLDLELARARRPAAGWIVLALALLALLDTGAAWRRLEHDLASAEEALGAPRAARRERAGTGDAPSPLQDAQRVARSLLLPWDRLFAAVEEASDERVALLALQPDPHKRSLAISGEARDYGAVLAFVERLDARRGLRDVHLVRHELREDDPQRPVFFSIAASWEPGA